MSTKKGYCQAQGCENVAVKVVRFDRPNYFNCSFVVCADCAEKVVAGTWAGGIEWPDLAAANMEVLGDWDISTVAR